LPAIKVNNNNIEVITTVSKPETDQLYEAYWNIY
jgi:hypothetical protein